MYAKNLEYSIAFHMKCLCVSNDTLPNSFSIVWPIQRLVQRTSLFDAIYKLAMSQAFDI